jgi:Family of unknown function (DUF6493)
MRPEDLKAALDSHDAGACIAMLATATEAERRAAAKTAAAQLRKSTAGVPATLTIALSALNDDVLRTLYPAAALHRGGLRAAQAAVLGTASISELEKLGQRCFPSPDDAVTVLAARRPPWVDDWAEIILSWEGRAGARELAEQWHLVRRLIREGICARPRSSRYIDGMIIAISGSPSADSIREGLLGDPGLLDEEIWQIFESEPVPGLLYLLPIDPSFPAEFRWEVALAKFADEGRLSRTRLLDASLSGLERDFHESRARWFALMHETLRPTLEERSERVGRYLGLAASRNPSTVTFCLKALGALDEAGRLEPGPLIDAIGPALLARAKGTVKAALDLIDRAAQRDPKLRGRAAIVAIDALAHESPAIHEAVLKLIERHGDRNDSALVELLKARVESVAPSQRARLTSWLGSHSAPSGADTTAAPLDDLLTRASLIDPRLAELAGIPVAIELLTAGGGEVRAIDFPEMEIPRLHAERAIKPVTDLDELIALFLIVLESCENPDDVERILDGVSRLCDRVPFDFAVRTGPLGARAQKPEQLSWQVMRPICDLAVAWITGKPREVKHANLFGSFTGIFARRVLAIARRAAARQCAPMLCAPTHLGGWIDPRVLVERVKVCASLAVRSDRLDGSFALLRLAPDSGPRAEALRAASNLAGPYARALRYALGGDGEIIGPDARIWVAAARARAPREDDLRVEARHPRLGPDAGRAAQCSLRPGPHTFVDWYTRWKHPLVERKPALPPIYSHDLPTVLFHDLRAREGATETRWMATIWPIGRDSFFAAGVERLLGLECTPTEARSYRFYLEALLDPDVPLHSMARLLLAGSLSANTPEVQGLATDALIAAVNDGRVDGQLLGEAIHQLLQVGLAKPARLTKALADAARVSSLHAHVVAQALQIAIVDLLPPPRDLHVALELLKELRAQTGQGLSAPGIREYLGGLKVSGKTAKLARDLLGIEVNADHSSRRAAAAAALAGRVERADRWMKCRGV